MAPLLPDVMPLWPPLHPSDVDDRWSVPIGVWMGASVRLHVTLVLTLVLVVGLAIQIASFELGLAVAVYMASLALHEAAHLLAAWREQGDIERVVLSPVGGLQPTQGLYDPSSRVFVAMAGPLANLAVVVLSVFCLTLHAEPLLWAFFLPQVDAAFQPSLGEGALMTGAPIVALAKIAVWINWPLFVLNLLPAFPFDGGEAARSLLSPKLGSLTAAEVVRRGALILGLSMIGIAPLAYEATSVTKIAEEEVAIAKPIGHWPAPAAVLATLGVLVCFGSQQAPSQSRMDVAGILGYDRDAAGLDLFDLDDEFLDDVYGLDQTALLELSRHVGEESSLAGPHFDTSEAPDERRLDEVLAKVHERGLLELTANERALLQRASDSFRRRRKG